MVRPPSPSPFELPMPHEPHEPHEPQAVGRRALLGCAMAGALLLATKQSAAEPSKPGEATRASDSGDATTKDERGDGAQDTRLSIPGKVVKVTRTNTLQPNGLWPTPEAARAMLEGAMLELSGKRDIGSAFACFLRPTDRVAIKPNGIAGRIGATMASNKELIAEIVRGVVLAGVPASNILIYEQFRNFLTGTRVVDFKGTLDPALPGEVRTTFHDNTDANTDVLYVCGIPTRYVRPLTDATAVINVSLFKDHSICGYTGCLKNITHGSIINPGAFHEHLASPQIAELYARSAVKSRVVLHIADVFKLIYEGGPLDRNPQRRIPYEAIYASTDPVALDRVGWAEVDRLRRDKGLPSLKSAGREPSYIHVASELGLGLSDLDRILVREVRV